MTNLEKIPYVEILVGLALADRKIKKAEKDFIISISEECGLSPQDINNVIKECEKKNINFKEAASYIESEETKKDILRNLFVLANSDGDYSTQEKIGIAKICSELGISKDMEKQIEKEVLKELRKETNSGMWIATDSFNVFINANKAFEKMTSEMYKNWILDFDFEQNDCDKKVDAIIDSWISIGDETVIDGLDEGLEAAIKTYNKAWDNLELLGKKLHEERESIVELVQEIQDLINSIANHPKEFDTQFEDIENDWVYFVNAGEFANRQLEDVMKSAISAGTGVLTGVGIMSMAPEGAMWIATTFGTASTGTAISTLSGAAAESAALAWLGGGTLAAGGGGAAAGEALLMLSGPVGWTIAGVTVLTTAVIFSKKKEKRNKEKQEEILKIKNNTEKLIEQLASVDILYKEQSGLHESLIKEFENNKKYYECDFNGLANDEIMSLSALINNTKSISKMLRYTIEERKPGA